MELSRNDLWRTLLSDGMGLCELCGKPTRLLAMLYQKKYCQLGLKETEIGLDEGRPWDFWNSTGQANKVIQLQTCVILPEKRKKAGLILPLWDLGHSSGVRAAFSYRGVGPLLQVERMNLVVPEGRATKVDPKNRACCQRGLLPCLKI